MQRARAAAGASCVDGPGQGGRPARAGALGVLRRLRALRARCAPSGRRSRVTRHTSPPSAPAPAPCRAMAQRAPTRAGAQRQRVGVVQRQRRAGDRELAARRRAGRGRVLARLRERRDGVGVGAAAARLSLDERGRHLPQALPRARLGLVRCSYGGLVIKQALVAAHQKGADVDANARYRRCPGRVLRVAAPGRRGARRGRPT